VPSETRLQASVGTSRGDCPWGLQCRREVSRTGFSLGRRPSPGWLAPLRRDASCFSDREGPRHGADLGAQRPVLGSDLCFLLCRQGQGQSRHRAAVLPLHTSPSTGCTRRGFMLQHLRNPQSTGSGTEVVTAFPLGKPPHSEAVTARPPIVSTGPDREPAPATLRGSLADGHRATHRLVLRGL
jgi:hypothetical protein